MRRSCSILPEQPAWCRNSGRVWILIHHYDTVDLEEVWRVAERDIPVLAQQIEPLIRNRE
jgi:uncharacterized protein with HEPN domain